MQGLDKTLPLALGHPMVKFATLVWTGILSVLTLIILLSDLRPELDAKGGFFVFMSAVILLAILTVVMVGLSLWSHTKWAQQEERLNSLTTTVEDLQKGSLPADSHQRFEEIESKSVVLGWVEFHPTLTVDKKRKKVGPGPAILSSVFGGNVKFAPKESTWGNVLTNLINGECDIIATPLYDIKERREQVEFTTPIFYADIGLFAACDNKKIIDALGARRELGFEHAIRILQKISSLKLCVHKGELQHKMAKKYFPDATVRFADIDEFSVASALEAMVDQDEQYESDLYFCERLQGEGHWLFDEDKIFNILEPKQLLFPVAFALRKSDDTLRKFVNLRLMTIDGEQNSGIQRHLIEHTKGIIEDTLLPRVNEYFLRKRPSIHEGQEEKENGSGSKVLRFRGPPKT